MSERVRAKKSLGQNFLTDPNIQRRIVAALEPQPDDTVVEIGPGLGALTRHMVGSVKRLVAIELDDELAARLQAELGSRADFELVKAGIIDGVLNRTRQVDLQTYVPKIQQLQRARASVVAAAFHPALAPVGVLLAVLGYVLGTYGGLLSAVMLEQVYRLFH